MSEGELTAGARLTRVFMLAVLAVLVGALVAGVAMPAVGGAGIAVRDAIGNITFAELPASLQSPPLSQRSVILANDGSQLATFYYENRQSVELTDVAPLMRQAIVAIEDSRFYEHHGIDPKGILRALVKDSSSGTAVQGASTITQQYVRQALVETSAQDNNAAAANAAKAKNLSRKLREARYALALEQKLTKDQILIDYLNTVYFGSGAYGISAAAQHYFSEPASALTLPQAALLSGIINNPSSFDPFLNAKSATARRNIVLQRMADLHYVTPAVALAAQEAPLGLKKADIPNGCATSSAPFFCQYVVDEILNSPDYIGSTTAERKNLLLRGGLVISTTLDPPTQASAQNAVNTVVPPDPSRNAGLAAAIDMIDPKTGAIKAMAVDRTYGAGLGQTELNLAANAQHSGSKGRHAGSTFKIFVLASAIKQKFPVSTTFDAPNKLTIPKGALTDCNGAPTSEWKLSNAADGEGGVFNMVRGTWFSVNTYFAKLELKTGLCDPIQIAESMGVKQATGIPLGQYPSFVLGAEDVDPLTVAAAYATFANQGTYCAPQAITKVTWQIGSTTNQSKTVPGPKCKRVLDAGVANAVTSLLQGVLTQPGATAANLPKLGRPAAAKTGTDDNYQDAMFAGYTPNLAAAVWVGNPDSNTSMRGLTVNGKYYKQVFGATLPGPIWQQAMAGALKNLPVVNFTRAPDVTLFGEHVTVPDLAGQDPAAAAATLTGIGLVPVIDPTQVFSTQPLGKVAATTPAAGASALPNQKVTIQVSNGMPTPVASSPGTVGSGGPGSPPPNGGPTPSVSPGDVSPTPSPSKKHKPTKSPSPPR